MASMDTFIAVCLALIVVELAVMIAVFAVAMLKVRDAASAVEVAAYRVDQEVSSFGAAMRSGWVSALMSAATLLFKRFR
jgi:O-glycosyl hydrolase